MFPLSLLLPLIRSITRLVFNLLHPPLPRTSPHELQRNDLELLPSLRTHLLLLPTTHRPPLVQLPLPFLSIPLIVDSQKEKFSFSPIQNPSLHAKVYSIRDGEKGKRATPHSPLSCRDRRRGPTTLRGGIRKRLVVEIRVRLVPVRLRQRIDPSLRHLPHNPDSLPRPKPQLRMHLLLLLANRKSRNPSNLPHRNHPG